MPLPSVLRSPWTMRILVLLIVLGSTYWYLDRYVWITPLDRIERLLERCRATVESRNVLTLRNHLADDFRAMNELDRRETIAHLQQFLIQVRDLSIRFVQIIHEDKDPPPDSDRHRLLAVVQVSGREGEGGERFSGVAGPGGDVVYVELKRIDGEWKIWRADYVQVDDPVAALRQLRESYLNHQVDD